MGRLIDADATIPMIKYATTDNEIGVFPIKIGYDDIVKVLNAQPTVDAEPVRYGTWKVSKMKTGGQISLSIPYYLCSECGGYMDASPLLFKYCPYCGAKMDAQEKEE